MPQRRIYHGNGGKERTMRALLVGLLPLAAAHTTISVSTPAALREAITDGAHIEVTNDMVIDTEFVIPAGYDVEIASSNGATLFATNWASHFRIDGKLRLENLVLTNGSAGIDWEEGCYYYVNGGEACSGGALHVDEGASLVLVDCVVANSSARYGGGLYAIKSDVEIYRSTFEGNQIRKEAGGAIYTHEHNSLKIFESKFVLNGAPKAGALFLGGDTFIHNSKFVENKAVSSNPWGGEGAAIWVNSGTTTISGSAFVDNEASKDGPAIHVYNSFGGLVVVSTTFENNVVNGSTAAISYATLTATAPVVDCADSCDDLGGGTCVPVDCVGCPTSWSTDADTCDGAPCTCHSCHCASQPTFPTPAPVPAHTPTDVWWQSSTTDGAASSALSPFVVLAAIPVLVANGAASLAS